MLVHARSYRERSAYVYMRCTSMTQLESSSDNDAEYKGGRVLSLYVASVLTVTGSKVIR